MGYERKQRVGDLVRQEIASMLARGELKDPRIGFVTITKVGMSPDLKHARVFFSVMGSEKGGAEESASGLKSAVPYIRRELARRLKLRHVPGVAFEFDDSIEYADHIERVIKGIKKGDGTA